MSTPSKNDDFASIVGKRVLSLHINEDQSGLVIVTTDGPLYFELSGDCCSESWWCRFSGLSNLVGETVLAVTTFDLGDPEDGRSRQEADDLTRYEVTTAKGVAVLEWRNSSNGYYSGWLCSERPIPDFSKWSTP